MEKTIQEQLRKTLSRNSDDLLECDLATLVNQYGDVAYAEVLRQLTGKTMSASKSKRYWREALDLRDRIKTAASYRLSIRAALLDLLTNNPGEFKNPVFIESKNLDSIRHCSVTDGLTGLFNQTYFKSLLYQNITLHRRVDDCTCALIILDLDHFKQYNDSCGHLAGDEALRSVANIIRKQIREQDIAARYGGDEFAVYLPRVTKNIAFAVANRIRRAVETTIFPGQELLAGKRLTTSSGIAFFSEQIRDTRSLIELADKELYNAKRRRNSISPSDYERRRHQRHATQALLECYLTSVATTEMVMVSNFSNNGVGIWSNFSMLPEDRLELRFRKPFWSNELKINGLVRQIHPDQESDLHYLGIEFEHHLDDCTNYLSKPLVRRPMVH